METSPVLITVYDRIDCIRACIQSLLRCPESCQTVLYVASDSPASDDDKAKIDIVRTYLHSISGFKEVALLLREENLGAYENSRRAHAEVFSDYDSLIRLEDDVLVGKGFLKFVNEGLQLYEEDPVVVGVCGYLPPDICSEDFSPFFLRSRSPYGVGKWKKKEEILMHFKSEEKVKEYFSSLNFFIQYESVNPHTARAIPLIINGDFMPGDILSGIAMRANGLLSLYPSCSITRCIGHDGSGLNSGFNKKFQSQVAYDGEILLPNNLDKKPNFTIERIISNSRRKPGIKFLNYAIYFFAVKSRIGYKPYKIFRKAIKALRKNLFLSYRFFNT